MTTFSLDGKVTRKGSTLAWRHEPLVADDPLHAWQSLLAARKLHEKDPFFSPALADLPDPFLMQDMEAAASRLAHAVQAGEQVHIFGDFDCDGVSGTTILVEALSAAGLKVSYSIPHRAEDGHGIGVEAVEQAVASGVTLGVSVDTGINCFEAADKASELGMDLIITDHHLPDETLPKALAVLNPARVDCGFADRVLCGAGVAFFLLMGTWKKLAEQDQRPVYDLRVLLDRVAMATVADVMVLAGVNRVLVYYGLKQLIEAPSLGMSALMNVARVNRSRITVESIGYYLAPRINAAGRMRHGEDALQLLTADDAAKAMHLAQVLDQCNKERRQLESETYKDAVGKIKEVNAHIRHSSQSDSEILVVHDCNWHAGVVGLVAGRLARKHGRPAAVGFVDGDQNIRVSVRGAPGYHVGDLLQHCSAHLQGFGGHKGAGGGTIKAADWNGFSLAFTSGVAAQKGSGEAYHHVKVDGVLTLRALHIGLATRLKRFEPTGQGNPASLWLLHQVQIVEQKKLKGGVIRLQISDGDSYVNAVMFGATALEEFLQPNTFVSLIGQLQTDDFKGGDAIQFVVEDILE